MIGSVLKYILVGIVVAMASFYALRPRVSKNEVVTIGIIAAIVTLILDMYAPEREIMKMKLWDVQNQEGGYY